MASSLHNTIKRENNPYICRTLTISTSRNDLTVPPTTTNSSSSSSFIIIRISHQKIIRIKIPKLLSKTIMHKTTITSNINGNVNQTNGADEDNNNKTKKRSWPKPRNLLPKKVSFMACNIFCGNKKPPSPPSLPLQDGNELEIGNKMEERGVEPKISGSVKNTSSSCSSKKVSSSSKFIRDSNIMIRKARSGGGERKKVIKKRDEEEKNGEREEEEAEELCKKRILMGEKCRPLNLSGALHYDKNGVLLPEL
ncbi:hypothetical protein CsSME_00010651 [Camellia sinensis var. sinensis]|uniref:Uncharacterized protein n=1 Tax=Camellia sinensis var. sinensis TaxID=542762 RepID=A0A4S4DT86_CAMSN|nr:hypothetical protein TEA_008026 [Camellia sinensis var. sinensis]